MVAALPTVPWAPAAGASAAPRGSLDVARRTPGGIRVAGWAADPDTAGPITVHAYVDGVGRASVLADLDRPDIGPPSRRGFDRTLPVAPGAHTVCVYAVGAGPGGNAVLGCRRLAGDTIGTLDRAARVPGGVALRGWAVDPDTAAPVPIHVYSDHAVAAVGTADRTRPDVGRRMPEFGANRGFALDVPAVGARRVCAYAVSTAGKPNVTLGCVRTSGVPRGALDSITRPDAGGVARIRGWALDPDSADPIAVHVYVDGVGRAATIASRPRPDVAAAFPGWGGAHGFDVAVGRVSPGVRHVCVYGISVVADPPGLLGCRDVAISAPVDPALRRTVLTPQGADSFGLQVGAAGTVAYAPPTNSGSNSRIAFTRSVDGPSRDHETCATWARQSVGLNQQGAALRLSVQPGVRRAITVTKNIAFGAHWIFNVHVWDSRATPMFRQVAAFDLRAAFRTGSRARPLPWRLCARAIGDVASFVVWPVGQARPGWGDPNRGGSVRLPAGWTDVGRPGWYVGHLRPGDRTLFTDLTTAPLPAPAAFHSPAIPARDPTDLPIPP